MAVFKSLSTAKNCSKEKIDDTGIVSSNIDEKIKLEIKLIKEVHVFAVEKFESYSSCVKCNGKVTSVDDDSIGECSKYGTI